MLRLLQYILPIIRVYNTGAIPTQVAELFLSQGGWVLTFTSHTCIAENSDYKIEFWTANKMYAYFSKGSVKRKGNKGFSLTWRGEMPPRILTWQVRELIEKHTIKEFSAS